MGKCWWPEALAQSSAELYDVGLGFNSAWQPQIASAFFNQDVVALTGSRFQGVSEASSGNAQNSSSNYPVVQLRSLDSGQVAFLPVDPMSGWSDTSFTSKAITGFPHGPALVTVFTNGIPSPARYFLVAEPTELANASARVGVGLGENVAISGFIIRGTAPRMVLVRGIGPSLQVNGVPLPGLLQDPMLQLFDAQGQALAQNDDWQDTQGPQITATGLAPTNPKESAILMNLAPGAYTAVTSGVGMSTGNALVEVYALGTDAGTDLGNISTRGLVQTGNWVLIGGVIIHGEVPTQVLFRAIGPELTAAGVDRAHCRIRRSTCTTATALYSNRTTTGRTPRAPEIMATGLAPTDPNEAAILRTFSSGAYTAIVRGKNGTTGIALVEGYKLP